MRKLHKEWWEMNRIARKASQTPVTTKARTSRIRRMPCQLKAVNKAKIASEMTKISPTRPRPAKPRRNQIAIDPDSAIINESSALDLSDKNSFVRRLRLWFAGAA